MITNRFPRLFVCVLLLCTTALVSAQDDDYDIPCPNDCSNRGTCGLHGVCACVQGWTGADCTTESLLISDGRVISSLVEENGEIVVFHTFLTHLTAHLVIDIKRTSNVRVPLDIFISASGSPSPSNWNVRAVMAANEDDAELVIKNGRNGEWFCGISFASNANSTRLVTFDIVMNATNALDPSLIAPGPTSPINNPQSQPSTSSPSATNTPVAPETVVDTTTLAIVASVLCAVIILILVAGVITLVRLRSKMERMYMKLNEQSEMR